MREITRSRLILSSADTRLDSRAFSIQNPGTCRVESLTSSDILFDHRHLLANPSLPVGQSDEVFCVARFKFVQTKRTHPIQFVKRQTNHNVPHLRKERMNLGTVPIPRSTLKNNRRMMLGQDPSCSPQDIQLTSFGIDLYQVGNSAGLFNKSVQRGFRDSYL